MEKKAIISLLTFFIFSSAVWSQLDFFPPGVKWYFAFDVPGLIQTKGFTEYVYTGDVFLSNRTAKRLARTTYYFDYNNPTIPTDTSSVSSFYMAQSGDSIFYYSFNDSTYYFLWRFNVVPGDQFEVDDDWQLLTMNVDSVKLIQVQNEDVNKIWIDGDSDFGSGGHAIIYDKFGPTNGFLYYYCWGSFDCYTPTLCRYFSDDTGEINFTSSVCSLLTTAVFEPKVIKTRLYPNPCLTNFTIEFSNDFKQVAELEIYNSNGQLMQIHKIKEPQDQVIDVFNLPSGIYFCKLRVDNYYQVQKLIKM